jgi:hypothetical protein
MLQYAQDAMETDKPSLRWQYKINKGWHSYHGGCPCWETDYQYRRKPQTVTINGFEVPAPLKEGIKGVQYYIEQPDNHAFFNDYSWADDDFDLRCLDRSIAHTTKEGAIASCKARLGIDPDGESDD